MKKGDIVRLRDDWYSKGEIVSLSEEVQAARVKINGQIQLYSLVDLMLANGSADAQLKIQIESKLNEAKSSFESAFDALFEAKNIARNIGTNLSALGGLNIISLTLLDDVLKTSGWNSSSLEC